MAAGWMWPLFTSVLRLVFISTLSLVNCIALYKVVSSKRYRAGKRQERLLVTTIIIVSLVYLSVVWAPFTFSALKHDLNDLREQRLLEQREEFEEDIVYPKALSLKDDILINTDDNLRENEITVEYIDLLPSLDDIFEDAAEKDGDLSSEFPRITNNEDQPLEEEFVIEYFNIETGEEVGEDLAGSREIRSASDDEETKAESEWTAFFQSEPYFQPDIALSPAALGASVDADLKEGVRADSMPYWNSDVQDFVTSSCAYSLAFTAVIRVVLLRRVDLLLDGPWVLGVWSGLAVGIPGAITLLIRNLAKTSTHFAPHQPEYTSTGYFLYNIICDVHISEAYVVSVFLEWAALFTLLLVILAILVTIAVRNKRDVPDNYGHLQQENENVAGSGNMETWARDVVLAVGAIWSWPLKPTLVLILYCVYGSHWTNLVCWLAHVVVAIPVVFIPLAVFLSQYNDKSPQSDVYVIEEDPKYSHESQKVDKITGREDQEIQDKYENQYRHSHVDKVQNTDIGNNEVLADDEFEWRSEISNAQGRGHVGENLKFYLEKGLKSNKRREDKQIILDNEGGEASITSDA